MTDFQVPRDATLEELQFLDLVTQQMLKKLDDRRKFIFTYVFLTGHTQDEAAEVLQVDKSSVSRHLSIIREILAPFKDNM